MREIEFLPSWYPRLAQRKRYLRLQAFACLLVVMGLGLWLILAQYNVRVARGTLNMVDQQLQQSRSDLKTLDEQLALRNQLGVQQQIMARLGLPVEVSRMISQLDVIMPREMSLLDLNVETEELVRQAQGNESKNNGDRPIDRRLRIKLLAVAPTDLDLANFLAGLNNVPFFEQASMTFSRDKIDSGHLMREFEVTFCMNLSQEMGN